MENIGKTLFFTLHLTDFSMKRCKKPHTIAVLPLFEVAKAVNLPLLCPGIEKKFNEVFFIDFLGLNCCKFAFLRSNPSVSWTQTRDW